MNEYAIPVEDLPHALAALTSMLSDTPTPASRSNGKCRQFTGQFPIEIRFSAGDDILLSPAYGRPTAWIGIISYRPYGFDDGAHIPFFAAFETAMLRLSGRPHWAKDFNFKHVAALYPRWKEFDALRKQLDPDGLFLNIWAKKILDGAAIGEADARIAAGIIPLLPSSSPLNSAAAAAATAATAAAENELSSRTKWTGEWEPLQNFMILSGKPQTPWKPFPPPPPLTSSQLSPPLSPSSRSWELLNSSNSDVAI